MNVGFTNDGREDHLPWAAQADAGLRRRPNELIEHVRRHPFTGAGKPEALKGELSGWWSRRITAKHQRVYRGQRRQGEDQRVEIMQCRYHDRAA